MNIIRSKFTKEKDMIYISHLDLLRVINKSLRRAQIKVSFSQGFNPHPKIAFGQALSLGVTSLGEYVDIELDEEISKESFLEKMNNALPEGIKFIKAEYIDRSVSSLMSSITHGSYLIEIQIKDNVAIEDIKNKISEFMNKDEIINLKKNKKGVLKEENIRPLIRELQPLSFNDNVLILSTTLSTGSSGNLKPDVLINKLFENANINIDESFKILRKDLYIENNNKLNTPI